MNLAKISANGQITVPIEVRRKLNVKAGDKLLFIEGPNGEIIVENAAAATLYKAQQAFSKVADALDVKDENDVQALVDDVRYRNRPK